MRTHIQGHVNQLSTAISAIEDPRGILRAGPAVFFLEGSASMFLAAAVSTYSCIRRQALAATQLLPAGAASFFYMRWCARAASAVTAR